MLSRAEQAHLASGANAHHIAELRFQIPGATYVRDEMRPTSLAGLQASTCVSRQYFGHSIVALCMPILLNLHGFSGTFVLPRVDLL
jgi:hypothetical protein